MKPDTLLTYASVSAIAVIEAINETLKLEPTVADRVPAFFMLPFWHFVPLGLLALVGLIALAKQAGWLKGLAKTALLRLEIYADQRLPSGLVHNNVWRWYIMSNIMVAIEQQTGKRAEHTLVNLFISFDRPVRVSNLRINSNAVLPRYEVKEFNNRFAVIAFSDALPAGTLEISVAP